MRHASCRPRVDNCLGDAHRLGIGQRFVQAGERVGAPADLAPWDARGMTLEQRQRAQEMARLAAPAAADLEMLAIDVPVRVHAGWPDIRVMAGNDVAPAV